MGAKEGKLLPSSNWRAHLFFLTRKQLAARDFFHGYFKEQLASNISLNKERVVSGHCANLLQPSLANEPMVRR